MSYSDFTLSKLKEQFGLRYIEDQRLFPMATPALVPEQLSQLLDRYMPLALAINTEKARSEYIVAPLLAELKIKLANQISIFSGVEFNIDPSKGLIGRCDYMISQSSEQYYVQAPMVMMVEAKNNDTKEGIAQCVAEMLAAQTFNAAKGNPLPAIYGVVTTGSLWKFLKLVNNQVTIDQDEYHISSLEIIFGILIDLVTVAEM